MTTTKPAQTGRVFSYMRWSSEPQGWGDSEKRQAKLALDWCKRNDRTLSDKTFADRGVSGWKGDNRRSGALGALLKVAGRGDTILVEDTDRWSREAPLDSLNALRDTVNKGVEVVFLKTGVRVTAQNFNDPATLFPAFFGSFLANSENEKKSFRVREAMKGRRAKMEAGTAVRGRLPAWIDWDVKEGKPKEGKPVVNEAKAKVVRQIFDWCLAGYGLIQIEQLLRDTPPITQRDSYQRQAARWNTFFLHRTLTDKSVLGFQRSSGLKVFPAIIDEKTFYAAGAKLKGRKTYTVKVDHQNNNLFTGLVFCSECGSTYVRHRGRSKDKVYNYLVCQGALRRLPGKCRKLSAINYAKFEASFLSLLAQTDLIRGALSGERGPSKLDALKGELADVQRQCEKYLRLIEGDENPSRRVMENLKLLEAKEAQLVAEVEAEGMTATMYAAANGNTEVLKALLAKKPDVNAVNDAGQTALQVAKAANQSEAAVLLENAGGKQ